SVFPGCTAYFHIDFKIGVAYNLSNTSATITVDLTHTSPNFVPTSRRWVYRTQNLFKSLRGDCLEPGNIFCGEYLSPDTYPPNTEIIFDGPEFDENGSKIFIATYTFLNLIGGDAFLEDSEISGSAVTGYKLDVQPANFEDLIPIAATITLNEGQHILYFASRDYAGNTEVIKSSAVIVDGTAPGAALIVKADGSNPSPWKSAREFSLSWTNPTDVSGIAGARIKFGGAAPVSNDEGAFYPAENTLVYLASDIVNGQ
ncbi:MAG: hypothetical protein ACYC4Q_03495, partial [Victivallaceae bacterium]